MRYGLIMLKRHTVLALTAALALSACASVDLPSVDFMGDSEMNDTVAELKPSFPSPDEVPNMPEGVRSAGEWDNSAREMQALYGEIEVPELEPALSPEEFDRQFEAAQNSAEEYKKDDPT